MMYDFSPEEIALMRRCFRRLQQLHSPTVTNDLLARWPAQAMREAADKIEREEAETRAFGDLIERIQSVDRTNASGSSPPREPE